MKQNVFWGNMCAIAVASFVAVPAMYAQEKTKGDNPILKVLKEKEAELDKKAQTRQEKDNSAKPVEAKPATKTAEVKAPAKPVEAKPATKPAEAKAPAKPVEAKPATKLASQKELKMGTATYGIEGKLALEFLKSLNLAGSESSVIAYDLRPNKSEKGVWNLSIKVTDGKNAVLTYFVKMDSRANVLEERGIVSEYVDAPQTAMDKVKGIFKETPKVLKKKIEKLKVSIEDQPVIGKSKVVRVQRDNGAVSELMVAPDDIVTTLAQIVVWMGTVNDIPSEGLALRWTADGKPFPVVLRQKNEGGKRILSLYRNDPTQKELQKDCPIVSFVTSLNEKSFMYPEKIILDINGLTMEIVRKAQGVQK